MKVSIITVSFNSATTITDTIKSVLNQDYKDIEYIIIDGNSSDSTLAVIEAFKTRIAKIISEPDEGIYDAMNKGLALATGDIIGILNSDDVYADNTVVSDVVMAMQRANSDACYADLCYVAKEDLTKIVRYWQSGPYLKESFLNGWMPPHPTFFLKRECYNSFGGFNTNFRTSADYEIMLRMLYKNGVSCTYLPRVIIQMRVGGQSNVSLKNRLQANSEDRRAWFVNGLKPGVFTLFRKPLSKISQFFKK
jgi:glycosyltransferase involved in cell wall biosynthesis